MTLNDGAVSALVLAAGRGTRMGCTKQLLPIDGKPVLAHVIEAALGSVVAEVVVVLGHEADAIRAAVGDFADRVRFVANPRYASGQSSSLAVGLAALDEQSAAAVVLLGDQPTIRSSDIDLVVAAYLRSGMDAARAVYERADSQIEGHPTLLGRVLWDEARALDGDVGARDLLRRHTDRVLGVPMNRPAPDDLDTPADYRGRAGREADRR